MQIKTDLGWILVQQFIADRSVLLVNSYGYWNTSMLIDEKLKLEINLSLQELEKDISPKKLVEFLRSEEIMMKHDISPSHAIAA